MMRESRRSPFAQRTLPLSLLGLALARILWEGRAVLPQNDDAYISYRYARNLLEGHGLVYNVGEYVEGFTNLLWTLLVAGGMALGLDAATAGHVLGVASGAGLLVATFAYARVVLPPSLAWLAGLAPWLVLSSASFAVWVTSGMETPLFAALVVAALLAEARGRIGWATAAVSLAALTRPEGALLGAVVFAAHLHRSGLRDRRAWGPPLVFAGVLAALTAFRLAYYGSPVPNTFYAKVGGIPISDGIEYLVDFLVTDAALLLAPALLGAREGRLAAGLAYAATAAAYVVAIGGDAFYWGRFLLPALPAIAVLSLRGIAFAWEEDRRLGFVFLAAIPGQIAWSELRAGADPLLAAIALSALVVASMSAARLRPLKVAALALFAAVALHHVFADYHSRFHGTRAEEPVPSRSEALESTHGFNRITDRLGGNRARRLLRERPRPRLVAAVGIGVLGYRSNLRMLDMVGLVDPVVARSEDSDLGPLRLPGHQRSNPAYILSRRPDFIVIDREGSRRPAPELALRRHPLFRAAYRWDPSIPAFRRRDLGRRAP